MIKQLELYKYINELLKNQNMTNTPCLQDIFSRRDYYELLKTVLLVIKNNPHGSLTTLRFELFKQSGLKEIIDNFVKKTQITPGVILDFGTFNTRDTVMCGNSQEFIFKNGLFIPEEKPIEQDTIFDLASTSKLLTSISVLLLQDIGKIDLYDNVTKYAPEFVNLKDTTIIDLLKFNKNIGTQKRIDSALNKEEALLILLTSYVRDNQDLPNAYTDIGAMILRYMIEKVTNIPFTKFVQESILIPLNMQDTHLNVPIDKLDRVANENYSTIVKEDGTHYTRFDNVPGTPHDPKALAMGELSGVAPGHAGWFSTKDDMIKLANALIEGKLLSNESLMSIADNFVGMKDNDNYTRFYGSLVYLKQPDPKNLSVYPPLSGKAFMSPGFAGTTLCIDPINKISMFIGSNRLHNRIYSIHESQKPNIKINEHNKKTFILPNGEEKIVCSDYTKEKEVMVKLALDLALQYQLLERLFPTEKKMHLVREL